MPDSGYNWDDAWTDLDQASPIVLTQGATINDTAIEIDCDGKASLMFSIESTYSDHAKATAGLTISVLKETDGGYEDADDAAWQFEMAFLQNALISRVFTLSVSGLHKVKLLQEWGNTTASSSVSTATSYKFATIPLAS